MNSEQHTTGRGPELVELIGPQTARVGSFLSILRGFQTSRQEASVTSDRAQTGRVRLSDGSPNHNRQKIIVTPPALQSREFVVDCWRCDNMGRMYVLLDGLAD